jgi:hypothetical protein
MPGNMEFSTARTDHDAMAGIAHIEVDAGGKTQETGKRRLTNENASDLSKET